MSKVAEVQQFEHTDEGPQVTVDHGGGANKTAEHFGPAGDDSQPLPGDFASIGTDRGSGRELVHGYSDSKNPSKAGPGEKRTYARALDGNVVGEVWLRNDGSLEATGKGGSITIAPDGTMTAKANGALVLDSNDVRIGPGAGRKIALVGDPILATGIPNPETGVVTSTGQILGPGSVAGSG